MNRVINLPLTPQDINHRLRARFSLLEIFALGMTICLALYFVYLAHVGSYFPYDYMNYRNAALGDPSFYYYGYWFLPFFRILSILPISLQLFIFFALNIAGTWFAVRIFGGKAAPLLFGYQMLYGLYFGQLTGIVVGGMAVLWWGIVHRRWNIAGIGLIILLTKFQLGIVVGLAFALLANISWRERLRILAIPVTVGLVTLLLYGMWPLELLYRITTGNPPNDWGSVSLWRWFGPIVLVLWIPVLLLPMSSTRRIIAIIAASALALPYFQQADLIALYVFPVGWLALLGDIGLLFPLIKFSALQIVGIVPLVAYVWVIFGSLRDQSFPRSFRLRWQQPLTD